MPLGAPGQAAARAAGTRSRADRRDPADQGRRPRHRLRQPRPADRSRRRPVPRRPLLPPQRLPAGAAAAARAPRRHRAARLRAGCCATRRRDRRLPWISDAALAMLKLHGWPGNVRELENVIRRALLLADGAAAIGPEHIVFDSPARLVAGEAGVAARSPSRQPGSRKLSNIVQHLRSPRDHGNAGGLRRQPHRRRAPARHFRTHAALSPRLASARPASPLQEAVDERRQRHRRIGAGGHPATSSRCASRSSTDRSCSSSCSAPGGAETAAPAATASGRRLRRRAQVGARRRQRDAEQGRGADRRLSSAAK